MIVTNLNFDIDTTLIQESGNFSITNSTLNGAFRIGNLNFPEEGQKKIKFQGVLVITYEIDLIINNYYIKIIPSPEPVKTK